MRSFLALTLIAGCSQLAGCAMPAYMKLKDAWATSNSKLVGMSEEEVLQCAGPPGAATQRESIKQLHYGFRVEANFASVWCVATLDINNGRVARISTRSGNPGGMTDGSVMCAAPLGACLGDPSLESTAMNIPTLGPGRRMTGDMDAEATSAQAEGESARNTGLAVAGGLAVVGAAAMSSPNSRAPSTATSAATRPLGAGNQGAAVTQRSTQTSSMGGASAATRNAGAQTAIAATSGGKRERVNLPGHSACISVEFHNEGTSMFDVRLLNKCAFPLVAHFCQGESCRTATPSGRIRSGGFDGFRLATNKGKTVRVLQACSVMHGDREVSYDSMGNQCYSYVAMR
jgi:hypothetical protein